jgi:hypothetical protein
MRKQHKNHMEDDIKRILQPVQDKQTSLSERKMVMNE